jgi:hypothetical protein
MVLTLDNVTAAMSGKRLRDYAPADLTKAGEAVLKKAYILAGRDPQIFIQADELGKDMAGSFGRLTLAECELAAKAGVAGEIGSLKTPSYAAIMQWLEAYDKSPMVTDARKILRQRRETPIPVTEAEGLEIMRSLMPRNLKAMWDSVRAEGRMRCLASHAAAQILDWLRDEGVVTVDQDLWRKCVSKARSDTAKRHAFDLSALESGQALIRSIAKRIYLEAWLYGLHQAGRQPMIPAQVRRIYQ